ncbi:MAG: hypothetical protein M1813_001310 [Trichoglossum hirsutum]|nr:MAG: hypothetical protein M1813_001310 [Trichoglossum hirsutum]
MDVVEGCFPKSTNTLNPKPKKYPVDVYASASKILVASRYAEGESRVSDTRRWRIDPGIWPGKGQDHHCGTDNHSTPSALKENFREWHQGSMD